MAIISSPYINSPWRSVSNQPSASFWAGREAPHCYRLDREARLLCEKQGKSSQDPPAGRTTEGRALLRPRSSWVTPGWPV